jgi:hypothetical protein
MNESNLTKSIQILISQNDLKQNIIPERVATLFSEIRTPLSTVEEKPQTEFRQIPNLV